MSATLVTPKTTSGGEIIRELINSSDGQGLHFDGAAGNVDIASPPDLGTKFSFEFVIKTTPAAILLRKAAGVEKGSGTPNSEKVGSVTLQQVEEIAKTKMEDLNANTLEAAVKIISGSARSMGITVEK